MKPRHWLRRALIAAAGVVVAGSVTAVVVVTGGRGAPPPVTTPTATTPPLTHHPGPAVDTGAFAHRGRLAFVSDGGLWVLDGSTDSLRPVAGTGPATGATDPVFSADGRWLAYLVDSDPDPEDPASQLWMARADGTDAHPVTGLDRAADPSWSPTADVLAAVDAPVGATTAPAVWLVGPTTPAHRLSGTAHAAHVVWSPDGRAVAFAGYHRFGSLSVVGVDAGAPVVWFRQPYDPAYPDAFNPAIPVHWLSGGGILFWIDTDDSSSLEADGLSLDDIRSPGGPTVTLGTTLTSAGSVTADADGLFAIVAGGDRYAWATKTVEICADASATCTPVAAPSSDVTIDPSWSADGRDLAFVEAPGLSDSAVGQQAVAGWDATHSLWVLRRGSTHPTEITAAAGASVPVWSRSGGSLLYEADDGLWLVPTLSATPVEIASPLFPTGDWPSYYAQVDWSGQFAWWSSADP